MGDDCDNRSATKLDQIREVVIPSNFLCYSMVQMQVCIRSDNDYDSMEEVVVVESDECVAVAKSSSECPHCKYSVCAESLKDAAHHSLMKQNQPTVLLNPLLLEHGARSDEDRCRCCMTSCCCCPTTRVVGLLGGLSTKMANEKFSFRS